MAETNIYSINEKLPELTIRTSKIKNPQTKKKFTKQIKEVKQRFTPVSLPDGVTEEDYDELSKKEIDVTPRFLIL